MKPEIQIQEPINRKKKLLIFGIIFDLIGMLSFTIPLVGEYTDGVWAP